MLVYLFRGRGPHTLIRIAFLFFLVPMLLDLFFQWSMPQWSPELTQSTLEKWIPGPEVLDHNLEVYRGGWLKQMELRVPGSIFMQTGYFLMRPFWQVTALMLLGMALFKWKVLSCGRSSRFYLKMTLFGLVIGYLMSGVGIYLNFKNQWVIEYSMFLGVQFNYVGSLGVALGYTGLIMIISQSTRFIKIKSMLAALGRMAFSNYILMTLICTFLFYGHGLGLYGSVERKFQVLIVMAIWILLLILSPLWLKRFRFGPLEHLWRSLTYWSWK
jgi:uncharacterized protein